MGVSRRTIEFYQDRLGIFMREVNQSHITRSTVTRHLQNIPANGNGLGTRHCSYRAIKTFTRWLHLEYGYPDIMEGIPAPILGKPILPALTADEVRQLIDKAHTMRDKAIIACFTESGLRSSEMANIRAGDIDWEGNTIRTLGKGRKEAFAPFGHLTRQYLAEWLKECPPVNGHGIWGIGKSGIAVMLQRLESETGLTCNPHTFRRTFASLLRKAGVDSMTIKDLGRWESIAMVQRYTRSVTFQDSMKFYRSPLA